MNKRFFAPLLSHMPKFEYEYEGGGKVHKKYFIKLLNLKSYDTLVQIFFSDKNMCTNMNNM